MDGGASRRSLVGSSRLVPPCRGLRGRPWHMCSLCSSCAPLAEAIACGDGPAQSTHTAPHRPVDASHSVPIAGGEMELELACAAVLGTLPASGKARRARCARRDCPGAPLDSLTPPRRARPTRRAPHPSQAVRSSWHCRAARVGHAAGFGQGALRALCSPRPLGCVPGPSNTPALALAAAPNPNHRARALTLALSLALSLSLSLSLSLALTLTLTLTLALSLALALALSLSPTLALTVTLTLALSLALTLAKVLCTSSRARCHLHRSFSGASDVFWRRGCVHWGWARATPLQAPTRDGRG